MDGRKGKTVEVMQVSHTNELEGGRSRSLDRPNQPLPVGAPQAASPGEADRLAAVRALIQEAQEYDADAIIGLDFEIDAIKRADLDGAPLQRIAATGIAVKFAQAA